VQGDHIYLNSFPALPDGSTAALLQPTLTAGQITAIKDNGAGIRQPQTDAIASGGSSGGAALNDAGQVVGILVSGAVDGNGSSLGQHYLMPLDSVREALARSGATPDAGQLTVLYNEALDDFWGYHYSKSLVEFRQVKDLFPAHAYAGAYIAKAQAAIAAGKDVPVPTFTVPWLPIGIAGGVLVLGSVVGLLVWRRPRRPRDGSPAAGAPVQPGPAPDLSQPIPPVVAQPWTAAPLGAGTESVALASEVARSSQPLTVATVDAQLGDSSDDRPADDGEDVDDIPEWEPIDYVTAFPTIDGAHEEVR
jgi:hypothetical protein